jgi:hypothetical protein
LLSAFAPFWKGTIRIRSGRRATRDRLWSVDPRMAAIVASLFEFDLFA